MSHNVGADELRVRAQLRQLVDGPTPERPPTPPGPPPDGYRPAPRAKDWLDDIIASTPKPNPEESGSDWWGPLYQDDKADLDTFTGNPPATWPGPGHTPPTPAVKDDDQDQTTPEDENEGSADEAAAKTRRWPLPKAPKMPRPTGPEAPRQALTEAWGNTPPRLRWLTYHATAAGAGWAFGWVDWGTDTAAWYAAGHWVTPSAFVLYGLGGCVLALYRRARCWAQPFAWAAAIPVSSVVVGVLLYGTGYQP